MYTIGVNQKLQTV